MYNNIEKSYANEARKEVKDFKLLENFKFQPTEAFLCHFDTTVTMLTMVIFLHVLSIVYIFECKQHCYFFVEENTTARLNVPISPSTRITIQS